MSNQDKWNLDMVRAHQALQNLVDDISGDINWEDVKVAHLDTGYSEHPVFGNWQADGTNDVILVDEGKNYMDEDQTRPLDRQDYSSGTRGHGSRLQSVLCGDYPGTYIGIARRVPVVPYRITNSIFVGHRQDNMADAIRHAVRYRGCKVISISLGTPVVGSDLGKAVDYAYEKGVIICAAAGQVTDRVIYPGKYMRTIGVGGVTRDRKIYFKYDVDQYDRVNCWAPAYEVQRCNTVMDASGPHYVYDGTGNGTSYATVHVAAAAAMWLAYRKDDIADEYDEGWMIVEAFRKIVDDTAQPIFDTVEYDSDEFDETYELTLDTGIINIEAILNETLPDSAYLTKEADIAEDDVT